MLIILLTATEVFAKDRKIQYTNETISDYFYGIVSASKNETDTAYQHLNKIQFIKDSHSNFNVKFPSGGSQL